MDWKLGPFSPEGIDLLLQKIRATNFRADEISLDIYPSVGGKLIAENQDWVAQVRVTYYGGSSSRVSTYSVAAYGPSALSHRLGEVLVSVESFPYLTVHVHKHKPVRFCAEFKCEMMIFGADLKPVEMPGMVETPQAVSSPPPPVSGPEHEMTSWSQEPTTLTPNEYDVLRGKAKRYEEICKLLGYEV